MNITDLSSGWQCIDTEPDAGDTAAFSAPGLNTAAWLPIGVPGDVNAALVAAGRMPNPHLGDNARRCYWVTARDWWYRLEFPYRATDGSPNTDLCLNGVDGHAELYLNGVLLGRMENAFRPYRLDVAGRLRPDAPNVMLIRFKSIDGIMGGPRRDELGGWFDRRTMMRKPQFSFGWDWSLPLPSIGLEGPVRLEHHDGARLLDVSVQPRISGRLDFKFQVTPAAREAGYTLVVRVRGHGVDRQETLKRTGRVFSYVSLTIPNPRLWWPNGLGEPALYEYQVDLVVNGRCVDSRSGRAGFRELRVIEEPFTSEAGPGLSFWVEINGRRVFCKGGNWIPLELWPALATGEQYRFYLQKAQAAHFTMLRVWGGGIYERDLFYDMCDELGIMVWQDFMFASAGYPVDRLRAEIIAEADYQIKRLRNHACIALWCGCNEDVFSWSLPNEQAMALADTGVYSEASDPAKVNRLRDDPRIYTMILRGLVSRLGLGVPYVESSPQSHDDIGNLPESGNAHLSCWKYALFYTGNQENLQGRLARRELTLAESGSRPELFRGHFEAVCSFDSEFCIQGPCAVRSLRQFLPVGHQWPPDDLWIYHIQRGHGSLPHYEQTMFIAAALFGPVDSLPTYVKYGQAVHAEMMRAEFESARRDRPNNGGTMMWMFNDCWPTSNWSIIDYYRRPKPSYYAARRACAPRLPIIFERGGKIEFFFSNDGSAAVQVELAYGQATLAGRTVWARERTAAVAACQTIRFDAQPRAAWTAPLGDFLFIDARVDGQPLPRITYFPDLWKDIPWPRPTLDVSILNQIQAADTWITTLRLRTDAYARFCHVILPGETRYWLDDNFFDISAGQSRTVTVHSCRPVKPGDIQSGHWLTEWP